MKTTLIFLALIFGVGAHAQQEGQTTEGSDEKAVVIETPRKSIQRLKFRCQSSSAIQFFSPDKEEHQNTNSVEINIYRDHAGKELGYNLVSAASGLVIMAVNNLVQEANYRRYRDYINTTNRAMDERYQDQLLEHQLLVDGGGEELPEAPEKPLFMEGPSRPMSLASIRYVERTDRWGKPVTGLEIKVGSQQRARMLCTPSLNPISNSAQLKSDGASYGGGTKTGSSGNMTLHAKAEWCNSPAMDGNLQVTDFFGSSRSYQVRCDKIGFETVEASEFIPERFQSDLD